MPRLVENLSPYNTLHSSVVCCLVWPLCFSRKQLREKSPSPLSKRSAPCLLKEKWSCDQVRHRMWHIIEEKVFHCAFAIHLNIETSYRPPHESVKTFLRYFSAFPKFRFPLPFFIALFTFCTYPRVMETHLMLLISHSWEAIKSKSCWYHAAP